MAHSFIQQQQTQKQTTSQYMESISETMQSSGTTTGESQPPSCRVK